jgi:hypothetical protein
MPDVKQQTLKALTRSRRDVLICERELNTLRLSHQDNIKHAFKLKCDEGDIYEAIHQGEDDFREGKFN